MLPPPPPHPSRAFHKSLAGGHDVSRDCNCLTIRGGVLPGKGLHLGCQSPDETFRTDPTMQLEPRGLLSSIQPQHTWTRGHTKTLMLEVKAWGPYWSVCSCRWTRQDTRVCEMLPWSLRPLGHACYSHSGYLGEHMQVRA